MLSEIFQKQICIIKLLLEWIFINWEYDIKAEFKGRCNACERKVLVSDLDCWCEIQSYTRTQSKRKLLKGKIDVTCPSNLTQALNCQVSAPVLAPLPPTIPPLYFKSNSKNLGYVPFPAQSGSEERARRASRKQLTGRDGLAANMLTTGKRNIKQTPKKAQESGII